MRRAQAGISVKSVLIYDWRIYSSLDNKVKYPCTLFSLNTCEVEKTKINARIHTHTHTKKKQRKQTLNCMVNNFNMFITFIIDFQFGR